VSLSSPRIRDDFPAAKIKMPISTIAQDTAIALFGQTFSLKPELMTPQVLTIGHI
jgi:hypothetical protein